MFRARLTIPHVGLTVPVTFMVSWGVVLQGNGSPSELHFGITQELRKYQCPGHTQGQLSQTPERWGQGVSTF